MWILKWLPDWIFYGLLLIGLFGYAATYLLRFIPIPVIYIYKTPIQIVSIALVVIGTFMSGAIHNDAQWLARVKEVEEKLAEAEQKSEQVNTEIQTKIVTKTQIIKEKGDEIVKYVDREIVKYDNTCVIPKEVVDTINKAAGK
jgi:hypothetical protein